MFDFFRLQLCPSFQNAFFFGAGIYTTAQRIIPRRHKPIILFLVFFFINSDSVNRIINLPSIWEPCGIILLTFPVCNQTPIIQMVNVDTVHTASNVISNNHVFLFTEIYNSIRAESGKGFYHAVCICYDRRCSVMKTNISYHNLRNFVVIHIIKRKGREGRIFLLINFSKLFIVFLC